MQTTRKPFGGRWGVAALIFCLFRVLFDNVGLTTILPGIVKGKGALGSSDIRARRWQRKTKKPP